jgi:hypothetical protein
LIGGEAALEKAGSTAAEGLEVYLVNARGTKNLPGRKTDVQECEWTRKLHSYGLLRNSFRPAEEIRVVRTIWRQRDRWVQEAGRAVQHMQKALTKMNVQRANTISDISGGKVIRHIPAAGRNRVANALRMAAQSLSRSNSYPGARYRRLRARLDGPVSVKAMARYLACLIYRMITKGKAFVDRGAALYEAKRQQRERIAPERRAANIGLKLVPAT